MPEGAAEPRSNYDTVTCVVRKTQKAGCCSGPARERETLHLSTTFLCLLVPHGLVAGLCPLKSVRDLERQNTCCLERCGSPCPRERENGQSTSWLLKLWARCDSPFPLSLHVAVLTSNRKVQPSHASRRGPRAATCMIYHGWGRGNHMCQVECPHPICIWGSTEWWYCGQNIRCVPKTENGGG